MCFSQYWKNVYGGRNDSMEKGNNSRETIVRGTLFFFFFLHLEFGMTMHEQKNIPNGTGNHGNLNFKRRYDGIR